MPAMLVLPGWWFRHKDSEKVCSCLRVTGGWVYVRYRVSGEDRKYPIDQFVLAFESIIKPTI